MIASSGYNPFATASPELMATLLSLIPSANPEAVKAAMSYQDILLQKDNELDKLRALTKRQAEAIDNVRMQIEFLEQALKATSPEVLAHD